MKMFNELEQGSDEWKKIRLGRITASNMEKIISPTGKESTQAEKYQNQLIAERITGESSEAWKGNSHSERGKEWEQDASDYYAMLRGVELEKIGFCMTDDQIVGASPDRFIGDDGMLEIKTGLGSVMIDYYLSEKLEQDHRPQTQCGLYVTGRKWVDIMLYQPLMKPIIIRAERNESYITSMCGIIGRFHKSMQDKIDILRSKGYME